MFINHSSKEVTAKIVYYGPGLSGKTSNLQYIFSVTNPRSRGQLVSIETDIERTLFFDLLPINVGLVKGYQTKFQLYTVPGQVFYDSTRKLVLKGADGVVFVSDSQELMKEANIESYRNLKVNLEDHNQDVEEIPLVFQYNKRDLSSVLPVDDLNKTLNYLKRPFFSAVAIQGQGVVETLREISALILKRIKGLLEHNEPPRQIAVAFDTDRRHKLIELEKLPLKKISADNLEDATGSIEPDKEEINVTEELKDRGDEELLRVETIEPANDYRDIDELMLEDDAVAPIEDLEEIQIDNDAEDQIKEDHKIENNKIENKEKSAIREARESSGIKKDTEEELEILVEEPDSKEDTREPMDQTQDRELGDLRMADGANGNLPDQGPPLDMPEQEIDEDMIIPIEDLDEIQLDEPEIEIEFESPSISEQDTEPGDLGEPEPLEPVAQEPVIPEKTEAKPVGKSGKAKNKSKKASHIDEIEKIKDSLKQPASKEKKAGNNNNTTGIDLLDRLKDKRRVTVIRKVKFNGEKMVIAVKDSNANLLDNIEVEISPETKKVTLILDVK